MKQIKDIIDDLNAHNYEKHLIYAELVLAESARRSLIRTRETGRYTDPASIFKYGDSIRNTYNELKKRSDISSFASFDNNVPIGQLPILLERSIRGKRGLH